MKRTLSYQIDETADGLTIKDFMRKAGFSRGLMINIKLQHGYSVNGINAFTNHQLKTGDILTLTSDEKNDDESIIPEDCPFEIIYEDQDILVINKPASMPTHPSFENYHHTLANAVMYYYQQKNDSIVFRCNNRLDKDTTGLTVVNKNIFAASNYSSQVVDHLVSKHYLALVMGRINEPGTVDAPIARVAPDTIKREVNLEKGVKAVTDYQPVSYYPKIDATLVKLTLHTGRTHQIRVHMSHIGHPLLGDSLYDGDCSLINRQALHAASLSFHHPITDEPLKFEAPLPNDMASVIRNQTNVQDLYR